MNRENEVLRILKSNPLISHDEIAEKLGITRSTVGVHILNLQKKGLIIGRGYLFSEDSYVCGVGSVNVDIYGKSNVQLKSRYDHPSHISTNIGGVTHNILENLVHLSINTKFISAVGDDIYAKSILDECEEVGIDTNHILKLKNTTSGVFMQILDENNDMHMAMTDFSAMSKLSRDYLTTKTNVIRNAKCVVCDPALPEETMDELLNMDVKIFVDPTSEALADKIKNKVGRFYFVKPNKSELSVLAGMPINSEEDVIKASKILIDKGVEKVCVSLGADGCYYVDKDGNSIRKHFIPDEKMANASGAGDAFMAAIIYGYINNLDMDRTLDYASAAGIAAIRTNSTINEELSISLIEEIIEEKKR